MMANAAKDPYWQAKVESEVNANPQIQAQIEDKCAPCHMPMGRTQAIYDGADGYSLEQGRNDPLAMDGVSCTVCHQIQPGNLGSDESFSGGYKIDSSRVIFGPYEEPLGELMASTAGYEPLHGPHILSAQLCATCHTLYTSYLDKEGNIAGKFPEQMPYFEWKASDYAVNGTPCQDCHVPRVEQAMLISLYPADTPSRDFVFKHQFIGGNTFMLTMLRDNGEAIGVTASSVHFDSTIARTRRQLQQRTAKLSLATEVKENELKLIIDVENLTGHKFPTGFPSRRAWLHVKVTNTQGNTFFESGAADADGFIQNRDTSLAFETHHDSITNQNQVQIYEAVMGDVEGQVTQTLLYAATYLKDNRLPPKGFNSSAERYSDIAPKGVVTKDNNFNKDGVVEGSGGDQVTYAINTMGQPAGDVQVTVELLYQSINPVFIEDLKSHDTPAVNTFLNYYDSAEKLVEVIQSVSTNVEIITGLEHQNSSTFNGFSLFQNYPNPFNSTCVIPYSLTGNEQWFELAVYDMQGQLVKILDSGRKTQGHYSATWDGRNQDKALVSSGLYIIILKTHKTQIARKIIMLK